MGAFQGARIPHRRDFSVAATYDLTSADRSPPGGVSLYADSRGALVGTIKDGSSGYNRRPTSFAKSPSPGGSVFRRSENIASLSEDRYDRLWIGHNNGVAVYYYNNDFFCNYVCELNDNALLNTVICIFRTRRQDMLLGTYFSGAVPGRQPRFGRGVPRWAPRAFAPHPERRGQRHTARCAGKLVGLHQQRGINVLRSVGRFPATHIEPQCGHQRQYPLPPARCPRESVGGVPRQRPLLPGPRRPHPSLHQPRRRHCVHFERKRPAVVSAQRRYALRGHRKGDRHLPLCDRFVRAGLQMRQGGVRLLRRADSWRQGLVHQFLFGALLRPSAKADRGVPASRDRYAALHPVRLGGRRRLSVAGDDQGRHLALRGGAFFACRAKPSADQRRDRRHARRRLRQSVAGGRKRPFPARHGPAPAPVQPRQRHGHQRIQRPLRICGPSGRDLLRNDERAGLLLARETRKRPPAAADAFHLRAETLPTSPWRSGAAC